MKTIVLDSTELSSDWLCDGLTFVLLGYMSGQSINSVYVPAPVVEEVVANYHRAVAASGRQLDSTLRALRRLGLDLTPVGSSEFDYRDYLLTRFDKVLGISVLPWPDVTHEEIVIRAVNRTPPFDSKGSGYRDSLVWESAKDLVRAGHDVVLVSADEDFASPSGALAEELQVEIEKLPGKLELVKRLRPWLLSVLPWKVSDVKEAVALSRHEFFYTYFLESDIQDSFEPTVEAVGFRRAPYSFEVDEIEWGGLFMPVSAVDGPQGAVLTEYDIDEVVAFKAEIDSDDQIEDDWEVEGPDLRGHFAVTGRVNLVVRVAVLFDKDLDFSVEELAWRRPGVQAGAPLRAEGGSPDPLF